MIKKTRWILSFALFCFTLCLLCFGVYSATNFQFIVNGNIEYNAPNVFAEFNTVIYSYPSVTSQEAQTLAQSLKQKGIGNIDYPLAHDSEGQAYAYSYRTTQDVIEPEFNNITLDFSNCGVYFIVINIKILDMNSQSSYLAKLTNNTSGTNIYTIQTDSEALVSKSSSLNIVVAIGLENASLSASTNLDCKIEITEPKMLETTYSNGSYTITGIGTITDTNLVIDTTSFNDGIHGEAPIALVAENAFANNSTIESVVFVGEEDGAEFNIGKSAFMNCTALKSVAFPKNIVNIMESSFEGCSSLTDVVFDGTGSSVNATGTTSSLSEIGSRAFYGCQLNSIYFPINAMTIKKQAFLNSGLQYASFTDDWAMTVYFSANGSEVFGGQDKNNNYYNQNCAIYLTETYVNYDLIGRVSPYRTPTLSI